MSLRGSGAWLQPLFIILEKSTFTLNQEPSPLCSWACLAGATTSSGNEGALGWVVALSNTLRGPLRDQLGFSRGDTQVDKSQERGGEAVGGPRVLPSWGL